MDTPPLPRPEVEERLATYASLKATGAFKPPEDCSAHLDSYAVVRLVNSQLAGETLNLPTTLLDAIDG